MVAAGCAAQKKNEIKQNQLAKNIFFIQLFYTLNVSVKKIAAIPCCGYFKDNDVIDLSEW